jgi:lysophospholipase L1-like esterase
MGLGASTVFGAESHDQTGWRASLREHLVSIGNPVNMVGSERIGDMVDNDIEAFPGARIDAVYDYSHSVLTKMKPNLAIIYVGSNDNFQNASLHNMFKRYYELVNYVLTSSPKVTIVMGTLMPTTETEMWGGQDRVGGMNEQLRRLYQIFVREGKPVVLIEMGDENGVQIENLGRDHMHPSAAGYQIMSRKFFEGILEADARGFLQPAEPVVGIDDDGEAGRKDDAYKAKQAEKLKLKEEEHQREEAAIQWMIEELANAPWDRKPAVPPDKPVVPLNERPKEEAAAPPAPPQ